MCVCVCVCVAQNVAFTMGLNVLLMKQFMYKSAHKIRFIHFKI